jgi:hypothetical protein
MTLPCAARAISIQVRANKRNREPARIECLDHLLAVNDAHPRHAMWAYATSLINGGRTDRLASAPRDSTAF